MMNPMPLARANQTRLGRIRNLPRCTAEQVSNRKGGSSAGKSKHGVKLLEVGSSKVMYNSDGSRKKPSVGTEEPGGQSLGDFTSRVKGIFLPTGYPTSVSPDYLLYQLWTVPTHITGWISISLVTSSLLRAVGVGASATDAAAAAASIKWITKDGVGALGRFLVGGSLGTVFDEDPRRWRMAAEAITTVGLALEISTAFNPQNFLVLASVGNLAKALGKGMGKPAFRVLQDHFSQTNNIGEVAAKEESWEVLGQVAGLLGSVVILSYIEDHGNWQWVLGTWIIIHTLHVVLRYMALQTLQLDNINVARAKLLSKCHIEGRQLFTPAVLGSAEKFLIDWLQLEPIIKFGATVDEAFPPSVESPIVFEEWVHLFQEDMYLLGWQDGKGFVVVKEGAQNLDVLKAVYQCVLLCQDGYVSAGITELRTSLEVTTGNFPNFIATLGNSKWKTDKIVIPLSPTRVRVLKEQ